MPELPEVEVVRRRLEPYVLGKVIKGVQVLDRKVSEVPEAALAHSVVSRRVLGTQRRGKWLVFVLGPRAARASGDASDDTGVLLIVHLRMTGRLLVRPDVAGPSCDPRFTLRFEDESRLYFYDVRRFGGLWVVAPENADDFFARLGVEPLGEEFTVARLRAELAGRRMPLKAFLLDQRRLAGLGNIYADESLFRARLNPLRPAGSVGPREAERLHAAIRETLQLGIDHEGTTVESFVDPAGQRGRFQEILNVYQRTGQPCRVCGETVRRTVVGGRSTHYCPRCQPRRSMAVCAVTDRRRSLRASRDGTPSGGRSRPSSAR